MGSRSYARFDDGTFNSGAGTKDFLGGRNEVPYQTDLNLDVADADAGLFGDTGNGGSTHLAQQRRQNEVDRDELE